MVRTGLDVRVEEALEGLGDREADFLRRWADHELYP
jgi:hypothetical protein